MGIGFGRLGRVLFALLACVDSATLLAGGPTPPDQHWTPTVELAAGTEPWLRMPAGTKLDDYSRYYYGKIEQGRRLLIGVFVSDGKHRGVQITTEEKAPRILDGGCYQITVVYDVDAKQTVRIKCNGFA